MATVLYRLGHFAARHAKAVIAGWLILLMAVGVSAATLKGDFTSELSIPGLASQTALDELTDKLPAAGGTTGRVVFAAEDGRTLAEPGYQQTMQSIVQEVSELPGVASVIPPVPQQSLSEDGRVGYAQITFEGSITTIPVTTQQTIQKIADANATDGLRIELGGGAVKQQPSLGSTEVIGVIVALVVLLITFGSIVAAGLPMITALIGIGVGVGGIVLATRWIEMSDTAPILALMLGLAVGIDYALFIVSKHRDQIRRGMDVEESIARANATAGSAVVFAGLTVLIALAALAVVGIPFLAVMGIGSAITVAIAVLIAVTFVPATLALAGLRILPKKLREQVQELNGNGTTVAVEDHHAPNRWITFITKHRLLTIVGVVVLLGLIAIPATQLRLGLPTDETAPTETTKRQAYDLVVDGFGKGANNPLIVTMKPDQPLQLDPQTAAMIEQQLMQQLQAQAQANPGAAAAASPELVELAKSQSQASALLAPLVSELQQLDGVASASAVAGTPDGKFFVVSVVPDSGASDERTADLVERLRDLTPALGEQYGATFDVTGLNVVEMDVSQKLADALPIYLLIVVGLALLLLFLVFRSMVVPIKAVLGFLLTIAASFGAVVAVYQLGWLKSLFGVETPAPIISFLPILLIGILFGLSMDYEMFLVSGMREAHAHGVEARRAVTTGYMAGSRVVTAAAIIMASVFGGFILAPDPIIASIGFALGVGVLIDAFVVRMALVPAIMHLIGERAWYLPRWMDRAMPNVDIEGTRLMDRLEKEDEKVLEPA